MADPGVPVFRGGSGSDCEEFVRAVYTYAFEEDKTEDNKWMATYAATRLSGKALRWYARQDNSVKMDWSALQVALLDQYPPADDEGDFGPNEQIPPGTIPTPAAATAPAAGVATNAAGSAPVSPLGSQITIFGCNKARIRVEDKDGTVKGWMSTTLGPFSSHLTSSSDNALHVKAYIVNTGGTELRVLNVDGWSRLCVRWSAATFDTMDRNQFGLLRPCDAAGIPMKLDTLEVTSPNQWSHVAWNLGDAGELTQAWRGGEPLCVEMSSRNQLIFYSTWAKGLLETRESPIKFVYEPIE